MNDLPPKHEKIVIVREYKKYSEALIRRDLYQEMEHQMELTGMTLDEFVSKALECYVNDLKEEQDKERFYLDCSEYQIFKSTQTKPVPIRPHPGWYYHLEEEKK